MHRSNYTSVLLMKIKNAYGEEPEVLAGGPGRYLISGLCYGKTNTKQCKGV